MQVGDVFGGERRRVVFALRIPELAALGVARVADVIVRYVSVGATLAAPELTVPVTVNLVSADEAAAAEVDHEVVEQVTLLTAAKARREAAEAADRGDYGTASMLLDRSAHELRHVAACMAVPGELLLEAERLEAHARMTSRAETYDTTQRKRMVSEAWRRGRGRQP